MEHKKLAGKIILVDDEKIEKELLEMALGDLGIRVELLYFHDAFEALEYLRNTSDDIFIIISDMNMPKMNGLDFKKAIDSDPNLRFKGVPFIFSSTAATKHQLEEAYDYRLQGYFLKPHDINSIAKQLELIINYWIISVRPDSDYLGKQESVYKL
ncbi:MAG: response regulator [Bacteroidia bacterium]